MVQMPNASTLALGLGLWARNFPWSPRLSVLQRHQHLAGSRDISIHHAVAGSRDISIRHAVAGSSHGDPCQSLSSLSFTARGSCLCPQVTGTTRSQSMQSWVQGPAGHIPPCSVAVYEPVREARLWGRTDLGLSSTSEGQFLSEMVNSFDSVSSWLLLEMEIELG